MAVASVMTHSLSKVYMMKCIRNYFDEQLDLSNASTLYSVNYLQTVLPF